ncbi:hypothetical protein [Taklimakanibacter deserti]|uniref:hypothetical protein n=1 Tax=Taklimakanibacter deserti TaxID=2267839 RepID=UPI0013C43736
MRVGHPEAGSGLTEQAFKRADTGGTLGSMGGSFVMQERPIQKSPAQARQAVKIGAMRYVLGFGVAGAAIGLLSAWLLLS